MIALVLVPVGLCLMAYGIGMLRDWKRWGTTWAQAVMRWQNWFWRRQVTLGPTQLRRLQAFGGSLVMVIGAGWTAAGIGLAVGWLH